MNKLYIGTTLSNFRRASQVADALREAGHEIPYPWWDHGAITGREALATVSQQYLSTIRQCDATVILLPGRRGSHVELGMALALEKPVVIWDEPGGAFHGEDLCAFHFHPLVYQMRGRLDNAVEMQTLVCTVESLVQNHARGTFGQGSFGHGIRLAETLGGAA